MPTTAGPGRTAENVAAASAAQAAVYPRSFGRPDSHDATDPYFNDPAVWTLAEFFRGKGMATLKEEDRNEQWYDDWLEYQKAHRLYASLLSPAQYSTVGNMFDILRLARFMEAFAYYSPSHGYSLQVTFLGLFAILMGSNDDLKREAVAALEAGGLLAFGVSEKVHGADLLASEFTIRECGPGKYLANGSKYYIGNANCARIIVVLARKENSKSRRQTKRAPLVLCALRPQKSTGFQNLRKIRTLGIRAAFVAEFQVKDYELPASDVIAEGRRAWDAILGTVTLGKFLLGFGSIGICEHAMEEAITHLRGRILYNASVLDMPHIRFAVVQAYVRLTAMKLYAYRALAYIHAASESERRYGLFCAVQKARVSTEGVKVIAQLSECIGAKGFESDTFFESALRDIQLIPSLEGSTHINFSQTVQFVPQYFARVKADRAEPQELDNPGPATHEENAYLFEARSGAFNEITFANYLHAYKPLASQVASVRLFVRQLKAFGLLLRTMTRNKVKGEATAIADPRVTMAIGQCMAVIVYAQLVAENAHRHGVDIRMIAAIFHLLVTDLSSAAQALGSLPGAGENAISRTLARRMIALPKTAEADWDFVATLVATSFDHNQAPSAPGA